MKLTGLALLLALLLAPLAAQTPTPPTPPPVTPAKESFTVQPGSVERGAKNFAIRLVANKDGEFATSSSKAPSLTFSAGVTQVAGSFGLLNQNEIECRINVEDNALGTCEVKLELFSVNGTTVLRTLRGTLGIKGESPVTGSQAKVGAESVLLVQVNSDKPQAAGAIIISGNIAGTVSIAAPTGTNFAEAPVATSNSGDINSPRLENANTVFSFSIGNPGLDAVVVRVANIKYNTQLFGLAGGNAGDLAVEVSGGALSNQAALVVNAFTAKTTIEGSNDNVSAPDNTGSQGSESTAAPTPAPAGSVLNNRGTSRPLEDRPRNRGNRNRDGNQQGSALGSGPGVSTPPGPAPAVNQPMPPVRGNRGAPAPAPNAGPGGGAVPAGGGSSGVTGMGSTEHTTSKGPTGTTTNVPTAKKLEVTPGLYFCDKDFNQVTALVLDKAVSDAAGGRVWIMLKLAKDKHPDRVETVTVKLTLHGVTREITLTETGKNTGEFRCAKEGILIVSDQNPNSNDTQKEAEPPKPRFTR